VCRFASLRVLKSALDTCVGYLDIGVEWREMRFEVERRRGGGGVTRRMTVTGSCLITPRRCLLFAEFNLADSKLARVNSRSLACPTAWTGTREPARRDCDPPRAPARSRGSAPQLRKYFSIISQVHDMLYIARASSFVCGCSGLWSWV